MQYRREIDGLRAIAVIPVIFFHSGIEQFSGGFVGVDVFFVISGYLISSIILGDIAANQFSMRRFYFRRARRILPALYLVMLVCLPVSWFLMAPHQAKDLSQSVAAATVFLSNLFFYIETDYFHPFADTSPLLHTWSLAIEEQFYIVFPLFALLMLRLSRNTLVWATAILLLLSLGLSEWAWRTDPVANFYLTPTRAWELLAGVSCTLYLHSTSRDKSDLLATIGLILVLLAFFLIDEDTPFPSIIAVVPVFGTVLIILYAERTTLVGRLLSLPMFVGIGLVSYSAYLWHQPLLAFARIMTQGELSSLTVALCLLTTGILSVASWRYVERPFRRNLIPGPLVVIIFGLSASLLVGVGYWGHKSIGWQAYKLARLPAHTREFVINRDHQAEIRGPIWDTLNERAEVPFDTIGTGKRVLIMGDSVGTDLYVAMTIEQPKLHQNIDLRVIEMDDKCMAELTQFWESASQPSLRCNRSIANISNSELLAYSEIVVLAVAWQAPFIRDVTVLVESLRAQGKDVMVVGATNFNEMTSMSLELAERGITPNLAGSYFYSNLRWDWRRNSIDLRNLIMQMPGVRFYDRTEIFCDLEAETCQLFGENGVPFIYDTEHLTETGARFVAERIDALGWFKEEHDE